VRQSRQAAQQVGFDTSPGSPGISDEWVESERNQGTTGHGLRLHAELLPSAGRGRSDTITGGPSRAKAGIVRQGRHIRTAVRLCVDV